MADLSRCGSELRRGSRSTAAFTLLELLIVIAIISLLAAMLTPALARSRDAARRVVCASNLRNVGIGFVFYADDKWQFYPAAQDPVSTNPYYWLWMGRGWRSFVVPYLSGVLKVLYCPSDETAPQLWESTSYGYSMAMYHSPEQINAMTDKSWCYSNPQPPVPQTMGVVQYPGSKVLAAEWLSNHDRINPDPGWWTWNGTRNLLFADGHVELVPAKEVHPANDGFPDFNLTIDGSRGKDLR